MHLSSQLSARKVMTEQLAAKKRMVRGLVLNCYIAKLLSYLLCAAYKTLYYVCVNVCTQVDESDADTEAEIVTVSVCMYVHR